MIRLTCCHRPDRAGEYFRLHLLTGDSPDHPAAPGLTLRPSWIGSALPLVELAPYEPPVASHLVRLCRGLHPTERKRLAPSINRTRAYYDLNISPPKTISLLGLLEPNHPVAKSVMRAHMDAVDVVARAASRLLQPQNAKGAPTDKWLGVLFHHTHTRENDPHLHSHIILPNLMLNQDGQWRAMQVVIAGPKRLQLELLYGHALAGRLRRLGFGEQMVMRSNGLPEIGSLRGMAQTFSKASHAILGMDARQSPKRPTKKGARRWRQQGSLPRALPHGFYDEEAYRRRRELADEQRKPKPKAADDPVKLGQEAERWTRQISPQDYRKLMTLLDGLDYTNPHRLAVIRKDGPPPPARDVVQAASRQIPERAKTTVATILREAIVLSAGRHLWNDLLAETRAKMARRKKALARIRAENDAISIAVAEARIAAANRPVVVLGSILPLLQPADAPTSQVPVQATSVTSALRSPRKDH